MVGMKPFRNYRPEPRRMGNVAIIASMLVSFCILSLIKARYCPQPQSQSGKPQPQPQPLQLKSTIGEEIKMVTEDELIEDEDDEPKPLCVETNERSDVCEAQGNVRIQASTRTIFVNPATADQEWKIKPYTRKGNAGALKHVTEWTFKPHQSPPACTHNHTSPALLFSVGGFTGNLFHDFTDVLVPLFAATRRFNGDVHLLTADTKPWWVNKFKPILKHLTKHDIVDLAEVGGGAVRCYPKLTAGLSFYKELGINAGSMLAFKSALRESFGLERAAAMTEADGLSRSRPRLLIISRKQSRKFLNENGMVAMATSLGFEVRVGEPSTSTELAKFARLVNSADVMIGVHGAGLTNMVFLPEGAVVVQVVPFGGLQWVARNSFKDPASEMGVGYLEYMVGEEESTVAEQYPKDHPVRRDPMSVQRRGWNAMRAVYLDKQDVRPHLGSLRKTLMEAIKILPQSGEGST